MSSYKLHRRPLAAAALFVVALALGACGFRPLYEANGGGTGADVQAVQALEQIRVARIPDREGQMMRTALERRFAIKPGAQARYSLKLALRESISNFAVERNAFATRANLTLTASYRLTSSDSGETLTEGQTRAVASYNILTSEYATFAARQDARTRAIDTLADDIRTRLAAYFNGHGQTAGTDRP